MYPEYVAGRCGTYSHTLRQGKVRRRFELSREEVI
jgi:hypothetical protein